MDHDRNHPDGPDGEEEYLNYREIERRRKERVDELAHRLLAQRERINRSIEEELDRFTREEVICGVEDDTDAVTDVKYEVYPEDTQSCISGIGDMQSHGSPAADTMSMETGRRACPTNLFFSDEFVSRFVLNRSYVEIEEEIRKEKLVLAKTTQVQMRMLINKRLTQVSGKPGQVERISETLRGYSHLYVFIETFALKLIEQGRLQVSSCPGSYRDFSELFCRLYSPSLMEYFRTVLFTKEATVNTVRGMYSIYFGVLEIEGSSEEAWFFIASLLNSRQNEMSCYVVECFFLILGDLLFETCRGPFLKLIDYTRRYYFEGMSSEPCKSRLSSIFSRYKSF